MPAALVPDQLKSGVTRACRYEPEVQRTYEELAQHYGTTVLPARPAHPRDKAKVEVACRSRSAGSSRACATRSFTRWAR